MQWNTRAAARAATWLALGLLMAGPCAAQQPSGDTAQPEPPVHDHAHMQMAMPEHAPEGWQMMTDGVISAAITHQGGPRGGDGVYAPNWWMGMASRSTAHGEFSFSGMLSLDPLTVGTDGYREIFQAGETLHGQPLIDRQHPHDFFMQLAARWSVSLGRGTSLTLVGGPAGEAALGPVAFMHRASSGDNPTAPLTHHTFDSTHVAFGVVTAALDRGRWTVEGSVFNGREPDEHRWNLDLGTLDSVSGRLWFRPTAHWAAQVSTGHLTHPETLEPGNIQRTTASLSWTTISGTDVTGVTAGYGVNHADHGARQGAFLEASRHTGRHTVYGRLEAIETETLLLRTGRLAEDSHEKRPVAALTLGGVRDVLTLKGFEGGIGADLTAYGVPETLRATYGRSPVSFHVFLRLRLPTGGAGRMWDMRMSQPMANMGATMHH